MIIKNGIRSEKNGWIYISVKGAPYEIGYAHGYLVASELTDIFKMLKFVMYQDYGYTYDFFSDYIGELYGRSVKNNHPELWEEMTGITDGANAAGCKVSMNDIIFWNCFASVDPLFGIAGKLIKTDETLNKKYGHLFADNEDSGSSKTGKEGGSGGDHCTGFMAVGDYTADGKIVCGHNTFDNFITGQFYNVMLDIKPIKGARILMQASPGKVSSETDFYVTSYGFMCTETTIGGFNKFELKDPICCRIRKAMQYGKTLDEISTHLTTNNSGDYANAWLIGDTKNNIIMRVDLGFKYVNIEKKTNGYFIGFNGADDPRIRNLECENMGYYDMRRHQGSRRVRLTQLMEEHKGKINVDIGHSIMGDHYDTYLNELKPSARTCCSHYDLDNRAFVSDPSRPKPFQPRGALDGKVCDTALCKRMSFSARWGNSCGTPFNKTEFCKRNIIWNEQEPYLKDRPSQPWTEFTICDSVKDIPGKLTKSLRHIKTGINKTRKKEKKIKELIHLKKNKIILDK